MKATKIKKLITDIINDGSGMIYTDDGNGSGGPGFADSDTLQEMLDAGDFDDVIQVKFNKRLLLQSVKGQYVSYDLDTKYIQIEFNWGDGPNPYHQIGWIWHV